MLLQLIIAFSWFFTNSKFKWKKLLFSCFSLKNINKYGCDQDKSCNNLLPVSCQSDEWKTSLQKTDNEYTKQCSCDASYTTCHGYTTDDCSTDSLKLESSTTSWLNCSENSGVCDRSKSCEESTDYICCNMIESYINSGKSCCFFVTSDCKCITSNLDS